MVSDHPSGGALPFEVSSESRGSGSMPRLGAVDAMSEADRLLRIAVLADEFKNNQIKEDARSAAERIAEGRFYVACVGQFKRGKSTLLNALIGHAVLPTAVVPVTAVPTIIRHGTRLA